MKNLISSSQLDRKALGSIFELADRIIERPGDFRSALAGRVVSTLFFEPSTRTRLSFEAAITRLGGQVISTEDASGSSSAFKGESLEDTIRVVESYADGIVIRHPANDSAERAAAVASVPIINAGSGSREHPTQSILDSYTLYKSFGSLDRLRVAFFGDLKGGRTVHSLLKLLDLYEGVEVYCLPVPGLELPAECAEGLSGVKKVNFCTDIAEIPPDIDAIYQTRVQKERHSGAFAPSVNITPEVMSRFSDGTLLLHPLPRNEEISPEVDSDPRAVYFYQAKVGMYTRMALLTLILGGA